MILSILKQQAHLQQEKIALSDGTQHISYGAMYRHVQSSGTALLKYVKPNHNAPVAVYIDRNPESILAFYSVAVTGNFYVPIDIMQPDQRNELILATLKPELIVNATSRPAPKMTKHPILVVNYKDLLSHPADEAQLFDIEEHIIDTDPLYAMFTSGSTGVPKGALISYRSILDLTRQIQ